MFNKKIFKPIKLLSNKDRCQEMAVGVLRWDFYRSLLSGCWKSSQLNFLASELVRWIGRDHPHLCDLQANSFFGLRNKRLAGRQSRRFLLTEPLEPRIVLDAYMVRDINDVITTNGSGPAILTQVGDTLFFRAQFPSLGRELWKSDGTEAGTVLVKDIWRGMNDNSDPKYLTNVNGTLYFVASDGTAGNELWKSDGTEAGTVRVKDILPGTGNSDPKYLVNVNGTLYFIANDGSNGHELWKSDGTEAGTVLVKDIRPGPDGSFHNTNPNLFSLTNVDGIMYFRANDGTTGIELWKSDGTEAGTVRVKDIWPGSGGSYPYKPTLVNGTLYFTAYVGTIGHELWKSDGTEAGTVRVKDIRAGTDSSFPHNIANVNGTLYFTANDGTTGPELWKSDGTEAGTVLVKDIRAGTFGSSVRRLTNFNGTLYFTANDGSTGFELWKSDGTEAGTVLVKDIRPGSAGSFLSIFHYSLTNINGTLYFTANDGSTGYELWRSDGTEAGTVLVKDLRSGATHNSYPVYLTNLNGTLYFKANDGFTGEELWRSDGTEAGTVLVKDIWSGTSNSGPSQLTNVHGTLYFTAYDGTIGNELWKSDGTEAGTVPVKDIQAGSFSSYLTSLTNVNGTLYFGANDGSTGVELWKSDGTEAGTVLVKDIKPGPFGSFPNFFSHPLTNVNSTLYFTANDGTTGTELWKSDGTEAGTVLVKDIRPGSAGSFLSVFHYSLTNVNGTLYFIANDGTTGPELWKSDGTEAGTVLVKDIWPGPDVTSPHLLTNFNGTLYFVATDGTTGWKLWKSDGTEAGTIPVKNISPTAGTPNPRYLTNVNGTLYFGADDGITGTELWKSDGTEAGTVRVKDIRLGVSSSSPRYLTNVNGTLYFRADDGVTGIELWKSDGTEAGTVRVKDIRTGTFSSNIRYITNVNGTVYFRANDGTTGYELWKSDGTEAGTVLFKDIWSGFGSSFPNSLTNVNGRLYFRANDGSHGSELWVTAAQVVGSHIYHKGSAFDAGGSNIPAALDSSKQLAKEGNSPVTLSYQNLINSSRGINGLVLDIDSLPGNLTQADFDFQVSPSGAFDQLAHPPACWQVAPAPSSITVQATTPRRVVIQWPDNAISNRWLRVTIKANANTGLAQPEVYYIGHLIGETTGPSGNAFTISFADISPIRSAVGQSVNASSVYDIDKNGVVAFSDVSVVRSLIGTQLTNITIPAAGRGCHSQLPGSPVPGSLGSGIGATELTSTLFDVQTRRVGPALTPADVRIADPPMGSSRLIERQLWSAGPELLRAEGLETPNSSAQLRTNPYSNWNIECNQANLMYWKELGSSNPPNHQNLSTELEELLEVILQDRVAS